MPLNLPPADVIRSASGPGDLIEVAGPLKTAGKMSFKLLNRHAKPDREIFNFELWYCQVLIGNFGAVVHQDGKVSWAAL